MSSEQLTIPGLASAKLAKLAKLAKPSKGLKHITDKERITNLESRVFNLELEIILLISQLKREVTE